MGQDHSRARGGLEAEEGVTLWEGVPKEILWLVHSQVRQLLSAHYTALLYRPEQLQNVDEEQESRSGQLQQHEAMLAHSALRDKVLMPQLQKQLNEAQFWDNFFSHVDVIKVRLVTDFLCAQDNYHTEQKSKHAEWLRLFDSMEPEMQMNIERASERIAARQQPPPPSSIELQMGIDSRRTARWSVDGESWLKYVEDGPYEVAKVLRRERARRTAATGSNPSEPEGRRDPLLSSPFTLRDVESSPCSNAAASPRSLAAAPAALTAASRSAFPVPPRTPSQSGLRTPSQSSLRWSSQPELELAQPALDESLSAPSQPEMKMQGQPDQVLANPSAMVEAGML